MKIRNTLLDYSIVEDKTILLVTTNSTVKANGEVVMGRGAAKAVKDLYPEYPKALGDALRGRKSYGIIRPKGWRIAAFQVKYHWKDDADMDLIVASTRMLKHQAEKNPEWTFRINMPGVGNGKLSRDMVEPVLLSLPDNVEVYV